MENKNESLPAPICPNCKAKMNCRGCILYGGGKHAVTDWICWNCDYEVNDDPRATVINNKAE